MTLAAYLTYINDYFILIARSIGIAMGATARTTLYPFLTSAIISCFIIRLAFKRK